MKQILAPRDYIEAASSLAAFAHTGQKYGEFDYYKHHVVGVYDACIKQPTNDRVSREELGAVALLHDVLEDSHVGAGLINIYFSPNVVDCVLLLTHVSPMTRETYIKRIVANRATHPIAWIVKVEDTKFNLNNNIQQGNVRGIKRYSEQLTMLLGEP